MYKSLFRFLGAVSALIALGCCSQLSAAEIGVKKPPNASISEQQFKDWHKKFENKSDVIAELLSSAGLELDSPSYLNGLVLEASPYLLRHAVNPINWMAWNKQAFVKAEQENKLIFLSIGYSTCHWCHVMEKESFVDLAVAQNLNTDFVSLKVDRELQPDIDAYFTDVLTTVKGSAGWPITAILTPSGEPIWIDSYVNKLQLIKITQRFATVWQQKPQRLLQVAKNISKQVDTLSLDANSNWSSKVAKSNVEKILSNLDNKEGGLIGAPKFPSEALLLLTLESYQQTPTAKLQEQLYLWLDRLSSRGIRDHVHGGFHRYATDAIWQLPHYEKMLYNQALLIKVFAKAGYLLGNAEYINVAQDTLAFVERVMKSQQGGFYSAIDADYYKQEGRYYLFTKEEKAKFESQVINAFSWYQYKDKDLYAPYHKQPKNMQQARDILLAARQTLPLPHIDKKVLLSWNALLVDALIELYLVTNDAQYKAKALSLVNMIEDKLVVNGELKRAYYLNEAGGEALFEDYVYLAQAYHSLFIATFDSAWQSKTRALLREITNKGLNPEVIRNSSDGELLSPSAIFFHLTQAYSFTDSKIAIASRKHKKALQNAYLRSPMTSYSSAGVLLGTWQAGSKQIFAHGNGRLQLLLAPDKLAKLVITLRPGWHINSHNPNEQALIATELSIDGQKISDQYYPKPVERRLGFSNKPLSLFEEDIEVSFEPNGSWLKVKLQACSDKVCLLPESYKFKL